jgi:hypothetical protein
MCGARIDVPGRHFHTLPLICRHLDQSVLSRSVYCTAAFSRPSQSGRGHSNLFRSRVRHMRMTRNQKMEQLEQGAKVLREKFDRKQTLAN